MNILGIIPARGGSKGIPKKNIRLVAGKPLIAYTINEAMNSKHLTDVIVSTDSKEIAQVSKRYKATVFIRPKELARDDTPTLPVIKHIIKNYEKNIDIVVILQPTSPLRTAKQIDDAIELLLKNHADSVISIKASVNPSWLMKIKNGKLSFFMKEDFKNIRKQDQEKFYQPNGAIYVHTRDTVMNAKRYAFGKKTLPYIMSEKDSIDIDNKDDLKTAELFLVKK